jgi:hypothetical protein
MSRMTTWLCVSLLLGIFFAVAGYVLRERARAGIGMPAYSVYSEDGEGLSEAAHILGRLGWTPVAITRPIQNTGRQGLLILAEARRSGQFADESDALSDAETQSILRWVEEGNTLMLAGRRGSHLHQVLGVQTTGSSGSGAESLEVARLGAGGAYLTDVTRLVVDNRDTLFAPAGLPLWWVGGKPAAVLLRHGKGRVIVVADPGILTNRGISRDDNVFFLRNVAELNARDGRVYFDEYHHGFRSAGGFWVILAITTFTGRYCLS